MVAIHGGYFRASLDQTEKQGPDNVPDVILPGPVYAEQSITKNTSWNKIQRGACC